MFAPGDIVEFWGLRGDEMRSKGYISAGLDLRTTFDFSFLPIHIGVGAAQGALLKKDETFTIDDQFTGAGISIGMSTVLGPLLFRYGFLDKKQSYWNLSIGRK
jgi:hypothetical protein